MKPTLATQPVSVTPRFTEISRGFGALYWEIRDHCTKVSGPHLGRIVIPTSIRILIDG